MRRTDWASLMVVVSAVGFIAAVGAVIFGCAGATPDPAALSYGAQRTLCVREHRGDEPGAIKCMRDVDKAYGRDGGL